MIVGVKKMKNEWNWMLDEKVKDKFKVRFHLARGENYRHFQITNPKGEKYYFDPSLVQLRITNGKLVNNYLSAQKIFEGANKTVCSWIECDSVYLIADGLVAPPAGVEARYNPRHEPNWVVEGENADSRSYESLFTIGNKVFIQE